MTRPGAATASKWRWLAAQACALGLATAWLLVPGNSIFLDRYGSTWLPLTYIAAAVAGVVSSVVLGRTLRRLPLADVAARAALGCIVIVFGVWALLWVGFDLVAGVLLVLVPLQIPVGMMFVVGQAGLLLDVRTLKVVYPRVVAGFALGFVVGGLSAPPIIDALAGARHLVACAGVAMACVWLLVHATRRRFRPELMSVDDQSGDAGRVTIADLRQSRFVVLLVAFQMLSAIESQWLDFLVFDRAAARYEDSDDLAAFVSRFTAIAYGVDILFLLLVAGVVLRRRGLKWGLDANPVGVAIVLVMVLAASAAHGSAATSVFVLLVAARVTDLVLCDGMVRPSISAAYQAVPATLRSFTQTIVEGLGVPLAIGISGAALMLLGWAGATDGPVLPAMVLVVVVVWTVVAVAVYSSYRQNLLAGLRQRTLEPQDLTVEGVNEMLTVRSLLDSADPRDVRLAIDAMTRSRDPELVRHLAELVHTASDATLQADLLRRLIVEDEAVALESARQCIDAPALEPRCVAAQLLAFSGHGDDLGLVEGTVDDEPEIVVARAVAAARRAGQPVDDALCALLDDHRQAVAKVALDSLTPSALERGYGSVVARLDDRRTSAAAVAALARSGDEALARIDGSLRSGEPSRRAMEMLVRACRHIGSPRAAEVLRAHVEHPDRQVGLAAIEGLARIGGSDLAPEENDAWATGQLQRELTHASRTVASRTILAADGSMPLVHAALGDELTLSRRRMLAVLGVRHGAAAIDRVTIHLDQLDPRQRAVALEWLDVTLSNEERGLLDLFDEAVAATAVRSPHERSVALRELITDPDDHWRRPWLRACAVHAAYERDELVDDLESAVAVRTDEHDDFDVVHDTWSALRRRRLDTAQR